jgi:hypothetical protein
VTHSELHICIFFLLKIPSHTANQDYTPATNAVIFPATASVVCTSFGIIDDDILEDPEIFCVDFEVQPLMFNVPVERVIANSLVTILDDERKQLLWDVEIILLYSKVEILQQTVEIHK